MPAKSWQARAEKILKVEKGKHLTAALIKSVQKGAAARVPVGEYKAWVAQLIEDNGLEVKTEKGGQQRRQLEGGGTVPRSLGLATEGARIDTIMVERGGINSEWAKLRFSTRKWVQEQTGGAKVSDGEEPVGPNILSPTQVLRMVKGLGKRGVTADQVRGTIVMVACEEDWTVGMWGKKMLQDKGDWVKDGIMSLHEKGWITMEEVEDALEVAPLVVDEWEDRLTVISFGSGWEEVVEGYEKEVRVIRNDTTRRYKGTLEGWTVPQLMLDCSKGGEHLVHKACLTACLNKNFFLGGHFSPESITQDTIDRMEEGGRVLASVKEIKALKGIVAGITNYLRANPEWSFVLDLPKGAALETHPLIKRLERDLCIKPVEVRMCSYGYKWKKPTMVWTNLGKFWTPRSLTQHCKHCRDNTPHSQRIVKRNEKDRRPVAQLEGFTKEATRNKIAPRLAQEWAKAMVSKLRRNWIK